MITFKNEKDEVSKTLVKLENEDGQVWKVSEKELEKLFEDIIDNRPEYIEKIVEKAVEDLETEIDYLNGNIRDLEEQIEEYED